MKKNEYVETKWHVDDKGIIHMEFPVELLMYVQDTDWVAYKDGIVKACKLKMNENRQ